MSRQRAAVHLAELLAMGVRTLTGVRYANLHALFRLEIPTLAAVKPVRITPIKRKSVPHHHRVQDEIDPALPGDGGRVWAELGKAPVVGIYQTHSSESFWPYVPAGSATAYSTDWSKTIVQVGWWLAQDLHNLGIAAVQSRVNNMSEGLLASYNKSYYTAKTLLRWYPSVRLLIDLHRASSDLAPATISGHPVAKILIVVGTDKLLPNPYWQQNLKFAKKLSHALRMVAPEILEGSGIDIVPYRYNQQLIPADLMIEVGGPNNTLQEESYAVGALAHAIRILMNDGTVQVHP
jgi:stage II sporulation protein P